MNRSFLSILTAVLNDEDDIPELPDDALKTVTQVGQVVSGDGVTSQLLKKVKRLQTLCGLDFATYGMPSVTKVPSVRLTAIFFARNTIERIEMIEQLIVEVVREAVPVERERHDVGYAVHLSDSLMYYPKLNA